MRFTTDQNIPTVFSHSVGRSRGAEGAAALSARTVPVTEVSCTSPVGRLAGGGLITDLFS